MDKPQTVEITFYPYSRYRPREQGAYLTQLQFGKDIEFQDDHWVCYLSEGGKKHYDWEYSNGDSGVVAWAKIPKVLRGK